MQTIPRDTACLSPVEKFPRTLRVRTPYIPSPMLYRTHSFAIRHVAAPLRRALLGALLCLSFPAWLHAAGITFNFTLPAAYTTSAAVYDSNHHLIKTLWRKVAYAAGAQQAVWDGTKDDGTTAPAGSYTVKVLYHNVNYVWEGVIGNTDTSFTSVKTGGDMVWHGDALISDIAINGTNLFFAMGYAEGDANASRATTSAPNTPKQMVFVDNIADAAVQFVFTATDGTWTYFANANDGFSNASCIMAYSVANNSEQVFTNGVSFQAIGWGATYNNVIDLTPAGPNNTSVNPPTGLAVQQTGSILAVAHGGANEVRLFDKRGGQLLGSISSTNPGKIAFHPTTNDLWVITGTTVKRYTAAQVAGVHSNGVILTAAATISGLTSPLAVAVDPRSGVDLVLVTDGGTSQQIKGYTSSGGTGSGWSTALGAAGGYNATNGNNVTTGKFWFGAPGFIGIQSDGSFWVDDSTNKRALHYSSARAYLEQIAYLPRNYTQTTDPNTPTRIIAENWLEYQVDYTKTLSPGDPGAAGGNNSWKLIKNWKVGVASDYMGSGVGIGLNTVTTLSNGRVYGLMLDNTTSMMAVVELPASGLLRLTGIEIARGATLYPNGDLRSAAVANGVQTISNQALTGFDASGNPQWGNATTLASSAAGTGDPYYRGSFSGAKGPQFPVTDSNVVISFDQSIGTGAANRMHLGGIAVGGTSWLWEVSPSTSSIDYNDPAQRTGLFAIAQGVNYGGNCVQVSGQNIVYGYHGEGWNGEEANQYMHFWDDGLFVGEFGIPSSAGNTNAVAGSAGNSFNPTLVEANGVTYLYHNDEGNHGGIHRWRLDGLNTIAEFIGAGTLNSTITLIPSIFETENLNVAAQSAATHRVITEVNFSNGLGTILDATVVGDYVTYLLPAIPAGTYDVRVGVKTFNTRGIWQLAVGRADNFNGTKTNVSTPHDEYSAVQAFPEFDLGTWTPGTTSDKWFQFMITGKNASSAGYSESFDYIKLIPQ